MVAERSAQVRSPPVQRVRALIVTNMYPTAARPALGSFVRDQVRALERTNEVEIEVFAFPPGGAGSYARAAVALRRRYGRRDFDVVHAHFGLSLWPALAARGRIHAVTLHGTDLSHPRSRPLTLAGLRLLDLVGAVSAPLAATIPDWALAKPAAILPAGIDTHRFRPLPRSDARATLGLDPQEPCLLFGADPARPEKRVDRAREVAGAVRLHCLGDVAPEQVPLWVNAANAVLVPSEREGFGLAALEALACDVPVLATPVGIAPEALAGVNGTLCAPYDRSVWAQALAPHLATADPRVAGRDVAERYSTDAMAQLLLAAWRRALGA
jgi:teichuronic acid biosynthesis glycosyltransferase TuaC